MVYILLLPRPPHADTAIPPGGDGNRPVQVRSEYVGARAAQAGEDDGVGVAVAVARADGD